MMLMQTTADLPDDVDLAERDFPTFTVSEKAQRITLEQTLEIEDEP